MDHFNFLKPRKRIVNHNDRFRNYCTVMKEGKRYYLKPLPSNNAVKNLFSHLVGIAQDTGYITISDIAKVITAYTPLDNGVVERAEGLRFNQVAHDTIELFYKYLSKHDHHLGIIIQGKIKINQMEDKEIETIYKVPKEDVYLAVLKRHPTLIIIFPEEDKKFI